MAALLFGSLFLLSLATAELAEHKVTSLPGLAQDSLDRLNMFSGYISTPHPNGTVFTHYWLVKNSEGDASAPTLVWQQGGPGGSSLIGLFTENGPLTLNDFGGPFLTEHGWEKVANVLYVEHPAPTGFSYCEPGPCTWDDWTQADTALLFYEAFFGEYPELAENPFYFSGESYAGVLVPTVTKLLLDARNATNEHRAPWSVKGLALGNDCPGYGVSTCTPYSGWIGTKDALDFRFRHAMIPESLYNEINEACRGLWGTFDPPASKRCVELLEDPIRPCLSVAGDTYDMGGGYYLYDTCGTDLLALDSATHRPRMDGPAPEQRAEEPFPNNAGTYACGQEAASSAWLNKDEVRAAIHVQSRNESGRDFAFSTSLKYTHTAFSLVDEYKSVILPAGVRVLQFSGDADPCVPHVGTERWIESLQLPVVDAWRPWSASGNQVAGYVRTYALTEDGQGAKLTFATVRDAGHMVPRYKGREALHMISRWLAEDRL